MDISMAQREWIDEKTAQNRHHVETKLQQMCSMAPKLGLIAHQKNIQKFKEIRRHLFSISLH